MKDLKFGKLSIASPSWEEKVTLLFLFDPQEDKGELRQAHRSYKEIVADGGDVNYNVTAVKLHFLVEGTNVGQSTVRRGENYIYHRGMKAPCDLPFYHNILAATPPYIIQEFEKNFSDYQRAYPKEAEEFKKILGEVRAYRLEYDLE